MRVCVIGGGLAGSLLAWRLAQRDCEVYLAAGPAGPADAPAVSGGSVRAYEVDPAQRSLALDSMAELAADARLAEWAGFVGCGSVYLPQNGDGLVDAAAEINAVLPGSASVLDAAELRAGGWAGLADDVLGILETQAGYLSPARLRRSVLADLAQRRITVLEPGFVDELGDGMLVLNGQRHFFDVVVVAAGAWTPSLLSQTGHDPGGLTTKGIQYTIHQADGVPSTAFVDDISDLFGRPTPDGVLIGLPTQAWHVPPAGLPVDLELSARTAALAVSRLPGLRLHSASVPVTAVDCYAPDYLLALRPVAGSDGRLLSFSGGSGSSVKTVLAASNRAARVLSDPAATLNPHHDIERSALTP
jgi:glycine/D-amino acid oxidase-like deaminating enzyme